MTQPDPATYMRYFRADEAATKANKWQGRNFFRWINKDYDVLQDAAEAEVDPIKRAGMYIKLNDMVINDVVVINVLHRLKVAAVSNQLHAPVSGWANDLGMLQEWYKDA
jgi:peptide/nickel transport system substrate-binding protein